MCRSETEERRAVRKGGELNGGRRCAVMWVFHKLNMTCAIVSSCVHLNMICAVVSSSVHLIMTCAVVSCCVEMNCAIHNKTL